MLAETYIAKRPCKRGHETIRYVAGGQCVECNRMTMAAWRAAHPERSRSLTERWCAENPARIQAIRRRFYARTADKVRQRVTAWRQANPGRMAATVRAWRVANPEMAKANHARRRALKKNAVGNITGAEITALIRRQHDRCAICTRRTKLTLDHIIALSRGGAHTIRNAQMLCTPCNSRKWNHDPVDHARSLGMLL